MAVEVWKVSLPAARSDYNRYLATLSDDELRRVERLRSEAARLRFVTGRGVLRRLLGDKLGVDPAAVAFQYPAAGKPRLSEEFGPHAPAFNLSHSDELLLIALGDGNCPDVGIDLEKVDGRRNVDALMRRFGRAAEQRAFLLLPEGERRLAFYRWWTRKEAVIKGVGTSLGKAMRAFDVSVGSEPNLQVDLPAAVARPVGSGGEAGTVWRLFTCILDQEFVASVALPGCAAVGRNAVFGCGEGENRPAHGGPATLLFTL